MVDIGPGPIDRHQRVPMVGWGTVASGEGREG